jgi:2-polyprenyl-3-methyl-5-hydroxy-6-metoxy-1,4-benzoquinol methylase
MEKIIACPLCKGEEFKNRFGCIDYTVSKETFQVVECNSCGFVLTNPRPFEKDLGNYYKSDTYISHSDTSKGLVNKLYKAIRKITLNQKYRLISPFIESNSLLDIGCGTGAFLNYCKQQGVSVNGIEPDTDARSFGIKNYGIDVYPEDKLHGFSNNSFSVITMWHVLEHVSNIHERISEINRLLTDKGRVFIAVPNHLSYDAQYYAENWAAYDVPRHLNHFDHKSIKSLFEQHGLQLERILPMKFDAFYVSILSEEIKTGSRNFVRGMYRGFISNLKAKETTWSSQIYVFKKGVA